MTGKPEPEPEGPTWLDAVAEALVVAIAGVVMVKAAPLITLAILLAALAACVM